MAIHPHEPDNADISARELTRIREEYARRRLAIPADFYSLTKPANLFHWQQRSRHALDLLRRFGLLPLRGLRVLEIGCGEGGWLGDFESWGVDRGDLAGIELDPSRAMIAARRFAAHQDAKGLVIATGADIRCGDGSDLPWGAAQFDVIVQSTVFTSVLEPAMRQALASEMLRVLRPRGTILWYDFLFNNPRNPHVRRVSRREIASLFSGCEIYLRRITLAPPIARRLVPISWGLASALEGLSVLNTHYLGLIQKR